VQDSVTQGAAGCFKDTNTAIMRYYCHPKGKKIKYHLLRRNLAGVATATPARTRLVFNAFSFCWNYI